MTPKDYKKALTDAGYSYSLVLNEAKEDGCEFANIATYALYNPKGDYLTQILLWERADQVDVFFASVFNSIVDDLKFVEKLWK